MSETTVFAVAIAAVVALAVLVVATASRARRPGGTPRDALRHDRGRSPFLPDVPRPSGHDVESLARERNRPQPLPVASPSARPALKPADPEAIGVTRRQFFNRGLVAFSGLGISGFGSAVLAFLWPTPRGGFGSKITVGRLEDILAAVRDTREPVYVASGRFYLNPYPASAVAKAASVYPAALTPALEAGVVALYQKCTHLGCRVPWCATSQWFECPCHGSKFNRVGEKKVGPAPRGLDMFPVELANGSVVVDTGTVLTGVPIGTNTTGQEAEGPLCVEGAEE